MLSALLRQQQQQHQHQHQHLDTLHSAVHALKASSPSSSEAVSCLLLQSQLHPQQHSNGHHADMLPPGLQDVYGSGSGTSSESCASHTHSPSVQHSATQQDLASDTPRGSTKKGQHKSSKASRTTPNGSSSGATPCGTAGGQGASRQNPRDGGGSGSGSSSSLRVSPDAVAMLHSVQRALSKGGRNNSSSSTGLHRPSTGSLGCESEPKSALKGLLLQTLACRQQQQQQVEQQHHLAQDGQDMRQRLLSVLRAAQSQPLQPHTQPQFPMRSMPPPAARAAAAAADPAGAPSAVAAAVQLLDAVGAEVSPAIAASMRQRLLQELRALAQDAAAAGMSFDVEAETRHLLPQLRSAALLAARMQKAAAAGAGSVSEASQQQQQPDKTGFGAAAAAGAAPLLARTRTAGSSGCTSTLAAYIEGTLLAAALPPAAAAAGSSHPSRAQAAPMSAAVAAAAAPGGHSGAAAPGVWGRAELPLTAQLSRLLGLDESYDLAPSTAPDMLLPPQPQQQQQQQQQHLSQADDADEETDQPSSKRRRTARGACSNINSSGNSWLQAPKPPNSSSGRTSQSPPPQPPAAAAAAAAGAAGRPLSPPAVPMKSPPPAPGLGPWKGQVPGSSPAVCVDSDGCSHDYIEELLQQELTAAMLEQLGQP